MAKRSRRSRATGSRRLALLAMLIGLPPAFLGVGPSVMADGGSDERMMVILVVLVAYGIVGPIAGYVMSSWHGGLWTSVPGVLTIGVLGADLDNLWRVLYILLIMVVASLGAALGAGYRARREALYSQR